VRDPSALEVGVETATTTRLKSLPRADPVCGSIVLARAAKPFPKAITAFARVPVAVTIACTLSWTDVGGVDPAVVEEAEQVGGLAVEVAMVARKSD